MYDPFQDPRLIDFESYHGRLKEFLKMDGVRDFSGLRVLVPGSALGGECFAALHLNAEFVLGLEVHADLVQRSREIGNSLYEKHRFNFEVFDGVNFPKKTFDLVLSGHVIEHTPNWKKHLDQCLYALSYGGKLYLEFPSRFNLQELHTGLFSFEYFPSYIRKFLNLTFAYSALLIGNETYFQKRKSIQETLQQVSIFQIKKQIWRTNYRIKSHCTPAKGIKRLVIEKTQE